MRKALQDILKSLCPLLACVHRYKAKFPEKTYLEEFLPAKATCRRGSVKGLGFKVQFRF
jgi:hypothetical protein